MSKYLVPAFFVVDADSPENATQVAIDWAVAAKGKHENIFLATDEDLKPVELKDEYELEFPYTMDGLMTAGRFIAVAGNPKDGFSFFGLFNSAEDVSNWAETELKNETWWAIELEAP